MIQIPWSGGYLTVDINDHAAVNYLEPQYPALLTPAEIHTAVNQGLETLASPIKNASKIALILEDPSRSSDTREITKTISSGIEAFRGSLTGFQIVIAAGAHFGIETRDILKKVPNLSLPIQVHHSQTESGLVVIGNSRAGTPLQFNETVVQADLRLSISTVNIHPLAGFSGGGKILLPGVAGLQSIQGLHRLPPGKPGVAQSAMRDLMDEVLNLLSVSYSWHLISKPDGALVKIFSGPLSFSHTQARQAILNLVTCHPPVEKAPLLLLGCQPFDQNLNGIFKSLHHIPALLAPGGSAVLFNEAPQGTGSHYWRNDPTIIATQKNRYRELLKNFRIAIYSPSTTLTQFQNLFPAEFNLLRSTPDLTRFLAAADAGSITVLPYAPITLIPE